MWPEPDRRDVARPHAYDLFDDGRLVGRLEWRTRSRLEAGWYVALPPEPPQRINVDPAIDALARDRTSTDRDWELNAELSAILSTAMAVDAAERYVHPRSELARHRFNRFKTGPFEIHVTGIEADVLAHAVPELPITAVSDVRILEGELHEDALKTALRRIALLGGRVVAVFRSEPDSEP
ncbi:MAG TPA: hypothetical protein VNO82_10280 [Solirubrobacteraceae bacterium]|nr:hypothetical protein [Solirubrobacteraceae bacterium]